MGFPPVGPQDSSNKKDYMERGKGGRCMEWLVPRSSCDLACGNEACLYAIPRALSSLRIVKFSALPSVEDWGKAAPTFSLSVKCYTAHEGLLDVWVLAVVGIRCKSNSKDAAQTKLGVNKLRSCGVDNPQSYRCHFRRHGSMDVINVQSKRHSGSSK